MCIYMYIHVVMIICPPDYHRNDFVVILRLDIVHTYICYIYSSLTMTFTGKFIYT